ncbi:unnamed protein product [Ceutorhynchus assimilis]|uniref:Lymphoid-restricted membrane protein n=1 Tax=Ceutorhynchus assimilis TaxID=467358 RepID=A0A9N9MBU1_9CUCU|nr:unnamed protein product [Ceutorhynchus assimilis]
MDAAGRSNDSNPIKIELNNNFSGEEMVMNKRKIEKQLSLQDLFGGSTKKKIPAFRRGRSNSDGAAASLNCEAFPSLSNAVLEKLGLHGDKARERLSEESLEKKFTSLALAFSIDSTTIKSRCLRQKRSRDQTETNFNLEIERLKDKLALLKPLCVDVETADLLSTLFAQVDTLTNAASLVSIAAERFGAVQHEERLTESVQLMVGHVQALKQQRDSSRRQLQYTKRVLQEPDANAKDKKLMGKRRASADAVNLSQQPENFKLNRRTSDLSFRATLAKSRPTRLDLGMELNKIKENTLDDVEKLDETPLKEDFEPDLDFLAQTQCDIFSQIRIEFTALMQYFQNLLTELFEKWSQNGYLHVFLNCCAILCFSISVLTLLSIFLDREPPSYWLFNWKN